MLVLFIGATNFLPILSSFFTGLNWWDILLFLISNLILILILGVFYGLVRGFQTDIKNRMYPNQGVWESTKIAIFISIIVTITLFVALYVLGLSKIQDFLLAVVLEPVTDFGFVGIACIQHVALRFTLSHRDYIPWNYARFLDYCTERMFLQRVGGRYRFIHKMLQDHFAQMPFERDD